MTTDFMITGRISPERKSFSHEPKKISAQNPKSGGEISIEFLVVDNQLFARIGGDTEGTSNTHLKRLITEAEMTLINVISFTNGSIFDVDIIGINEITLDGDSRKVNIHYFDDVHDAISNRSQKGLNINRMYALCMGQKGTYLRRCLEDLRSALKYVNDTPFYCYRAIEVIRNHIGSMHALKKDKEQWEKMRIELKIDREHISKIKPLADLLRHGREISYCGREWREIVSITWDIVEKYIEFLDRNNIGKQRVQSTNSTP